MSGIPVYTQSPIKATKASGSSPQTAVPPTHGNQHVPNANVASTTTATSSYPTAQPGAPAAPAPTSAAQRYAPAQQIHPTPTSKVDSEGPPPPQPGAVPTPQHALNCTLPPPPKAGETYHPPAQIAAPTQQYNPPQMGIPPPTSVFGAQPPSSSTTTTTAPSYSYPVALPQGDSPRRSLDHPPGYVQNPYASAFSADQRRAQDSQHTTTMGLGNLPLNNNSNTAAFGVDPEGVWNTAKAWATTAGQKISEAETEIWKRVNGKD